MKERIEEMKKKKIRVLVVDDSAFMRRAISEILESDPQISVVARARDGLDALQKIEQFDPDIITLDINMPVMDGLEALRRIMENRPRPVVVVSSLTQEEAPITLQLLDLGAVDYIPKPSGTVSLDIKKISSEIVAKVKAATGIDPKRIIRPRPRRDFAHKAEEPHPPSFAVAVGVSTGGPKTLLDIFEQVPPDSETVYLVAQHMPPQFTPSLAERLDRYTPIPFCQAQNGQPLRGGRGYLAPGGWHMTVTGDLRIRLSKNPLNALFKPSVDVLFSSVKEVFGDRTVGILLTGIGSDGARGLLEIKETGGVTIAESEETAVVYGMPMAAKEIGAAEVIAPCYEIPEEIHKALLKIRRRLKNAERRTHQRAV